MKTALPLLLAAACFGSCRAGPEPTPPEKPATGGIAAAAPSEAKAEPPTRPAVDEEALDRGVDPCEDFYRFACGGWMRKTPIPEDRPSWSRSFAEIHQRNEATLRQIMEDDAAGKADSADPYAQKVGDFYAACMDEEKAENGSLAELREELRRIERMRTRKDLARQVAKLQIQGVSALFSFGSDQDAKDATQVIGVADQGGMLLPDRDYYLKDDPRTTALRNVYRETIAKLLQLLGAPAKQAESEAATVLRVETRLARGALDKVKRRDPYQIYHRLDRKGLVDAAPHFAWDDYFEALGHPELSAINVAVPDFFAALDKLVAAGRLGDIKVYLRVHALAASVPALPRRFVEEQFKFTSKLTGAKVILPRWKRCVALTDRALGEAAGRSFVARTFGAEGKSRSREILQGIEAAFQANLATLDWMDAETKDEATAKLHKIFNKIGYPEKWRNYDSLAVDRSSMLSNLRAANDFERRRQLAKIGKPLDRGEWEMSPPTVNAYYNASMNEMVFPAGILQHPFFSAGSAPTANAGGIGMVIGHELTHGFDDEGRQFDASGNLRDWWTKKSGAAYRQRSECVAKQYDQYVAVDDQHLNGHLTLGENIADIGGLKLTLAAYRGSRQGKGPAPRVAGFDEEQQLFLAFAQVWCTNIRPEAARLQALTNPHSTAEWRVNGAVSDNPDFARAFSCKAGSRMAPRDRCVVW